MKELICIVCPKGCHLQVDAENDYAVTGQGCPRGEAHGKAEMLHPTRVVTSTVCIQGAPYRRCPVKTDRPVPKGAVFQVMAAISTVHLQAPVQVGQVLIPDICGTGANLVATCDYAIIQ